MKKLFKENDLAKFVTLAILITIALTWFIKGGAFSGTEFTANETVTGIGLSQISLSLVYAVSFFLQQIVFMLVIGAFYGVITLTSGYKVLIAKLAKLVKGREIPVVVIVSALIALFTSVSNQTFIAIIFIPFIITVLLRANLDKVTAFATTFGALLVGVIGATYGTEGLYYFNYYMQTDITKGISARWIVLIVTFVIFSIFNVLHVKKIKAKKVDESKDDTFAVNETTKKAKVWPIASLLLVTLAFAVLGYVKWNESFGITVFTKFNNWLTELKFGETTVIKNILGTVTEFGTWELYTIFTILFIVMIIAAIIYRVKLDDFIDGIRSGVQKMTKPVVLMVLAYSIFVLVYWSPIVPAIVDGVLSKDFNVFTSTIGAIITSIFHCDFGYTGYTIGGFLTAAYADNMKQVAVIYPAMYGFVQIISPTSVILLAGLSYAGVSYKNWMKYIWKFALAVLVALLIIFMVI